jgi:hypothetical protein
MINAVQLDELLANREFVDAVRKATESWPVTDQLGAAARHAFDIIAAAGMVNMGAAPGWVRLGALDTLVRWADGTARVCLHNPCISRPEPVFSAAYKPGLVVCGECVALLRVRGVEDRTCDSCGRVCQGIEADDPIYPVAVVVGALNFGAGVCGHCLTVEES